MSPLRSPRAGDDPRGDQRSWLVGPGACALVGLGLHLALVGGLLVEHGDAAWFVHFGNRATRIVGLARREIGPAVLVPHVNGHDGQSFWVLARDPLLLDGKQDTALLDRPSYRAQRMLYPTLASPFRYAGERQLLWGLIAVNLAAVALGTYATARLAAALRAPPLVGLAFALNPAVVVAVVADVADALALAALMAAVLLAVRGRWVSAVVMGVAAALSKEVMVLSLLCVAIGAVGATRRVRLLFVGVPSCAVAIWALYARWRLGWPATSVQEVSWPFVGYVQAWRHDWAPVGNWYDAVVAFALLPAAAMVIYRWWQRRSLLMAAALPFALLVPFMTAQVLNVAINSLRVFGPALTLTTIDVFAAPRRLSPAADLTMAPAH
ncbi:MAG: hypothetical protein M3Z46_02845 [Actinomycetota bacterium]|nr:hypothetical protein [Actinomycetota bacterium]